MSSSPSALFAPKSPIYSAFFIEFFFKFFAYFGLFRIGQHIYICAKAYLTQSFANGKNLPSFTFAHILSHKNQCVTHAAFKQMNIKKKTTRKKRKTTVVVDLRLLCLLWEIFNFLKDLDLLKYLDF